MREIVILHEPVVKDELRRLVTDGFGDMVKYVVDVERERIALGGQLHADAEALLLDDGSRHEDLWGANYYPGVEPEHCIEFTSLINIRPAQSNPSMELLDAALRDRVRRLTHLLIGSGEAL